MKKRLMLLSLTPVRLERRPRKTLWKTWKTEIPEEENRNLIIGVSGCVAEKEKEALLKREEVNFVFGTTKYIKG